MTEDLITFLRAQLEEDERVARSAYGFTGDADDYFDVYYMAVPLQVHANRWCPARVLREVEAKRRILAEHNAPSAIWPGSSKKDRRCVGCGFGSDEEPLVEDVNDCPTLRALASIYFARPGFREEWQLDV